MLLIGLTGSIGMGKSAVAEHFQTREIPVCNADAEVHKLYEGKAVPLIERQFPGVTVDGKVDRQKLAAVLIADPQGFKVLEKIVHPLVREAERATLQAFAKTGASMAVLEIPLLFETGGDELVDVTIVVSTTKQNQRQRVLERPSMTDQKLDEILARQMPDEQKRKRADFIVDTSGTLEDTYAQIDTIIENLRAHASSAFQQNWS